MAEPASNERSGEAEQRTPAARRVPRNIDSAEILKGDSEITISHNGEIYRLRVTRNGKLILHK